MHRIAKKLALKVTSRRQRHSCLILDHGNLVSAVNNTKGHAEQVALGVFIDKTTVFNLAKNKYAGCTLISYRIAPNGEVGKSKPCKNCEKAISLAKIRKVIYYDGKKWVEEFR